MPTGSGAAEDQMAAAPPSMKTVPPSSAAAHIATPESDFRVI